MTTGAIKLGILGIATKAGIIGAKGHKYRYHHGYGGYHHGNHHGGYSGNFKLILVNQTHLILLWNIFCFIIINGGLLGKVVYFVVKPLFLTDLNNENR